MFDGGAGAVWGEQGKASRLKRCQSLGQGALPCVLWRDITVLERMRSGTRTGAVAQPGGALSEIRDHDLRRLQGRGLQE